MEDLRLSAVATRLVAWHNRHPFARRIKASQVHAVGYVALPFASSDVAPAGGEAAAMPPGGSLRERVRARALKQEAASGAAAPGKDGPPVVVQMAVDTKELTADFSEDFIDPLTPRQVARFALGHGQALARPPDDGPVRRVRADGAQPGQATVTLYLLTAVIETGTRKSRVLLGAGDAPLVLGRRVHSRPRLAALAAPMAAAGAAAALWLQPLSPSPVVAAVAPAHAASAAASAPLATASAASASAVLAAASAASPAAVASAPVVLAAASAPLAPEPAASAPLDVEPHLGRIQMASIRPHLSPNEQAAQAAGLAAEAASAPAAARAPASAAAPAAPPAFALSTRPLRTRAEADQVKVAMKSLLRAVATKDVRVDVLPEGDDWRVVGLPFGNRGEADQARALLVSRGMRVEVVGF